MIDGLIAALVALRLAVVMAAKIYAGLAAVLLLLGIVQP